MLSIRKANNIKIRLVSKEKIDVTTKTDVLINFLSEEDKSLAYITKRFQWSLLMKQSDNKLMDMVLEKARQQGRDEAVAFYAKFSQAPDFSYQR